MRKTNWSDEYSPPAKKTKTTTRTASKIAAGATRATRKIVTTQKAKSPTFSSAFKIETPDSRYRVSLDVDQSGRFQGGTAKKFPRLAKIFENYDKYFFIRFGVIGEGQCFFHSVLATRHPNLPSQIGGANVFDYLQLSSAQRRKMASDFRNHLSLLVKREFENLNIDFSDTEKLLKKRQKLRREYDEEGRNKVNSQIEDIFNVLVHSDGWMGEFCVYSQYAGTKAEAINFLVYDLLTCDKEVGALAPAILYAVFKIPIIFVVVQGDFYNDTIDCLSTGAIFDLQDVGKDIQICLIAHVGQNHFEPIFKASFDNEIIDYTHSGDSFIITNIKKFCLSLAVGEESEESQKLLNDIDFSIENAKKLRSIYNDGYAFPSWAISTFAEYYDELASHARVYYSHGTLDDAKILALQREPVNIGMSRGYNQKKMKESFGWKTGYYGEHFKKNKELAPNLAIYSPVIVKHNNAFIKIHLINSIGYAFDSEEQPDYQVLNGHPGQLYNRYRSVFEKIFICAKDINAKTIVMSLVGAGVFADYWPDLFEEIWLPAFTNVRHRYENEFNIVFMGTNLIKPNIGLFPGNISKVDPDTSLFVNAWDPWSIVGNGNALDNSLDGYVGRHSNSALFTWPLTNLNLADDNRYIKT